MFRDVVLYLWFVVVFVDFVHCCLYVFRLCMSVVAVVPDVQFVTVVVVVLGDVEVGWKM